MQGRVHNPSGEGVRAVSATVKSRTARLNEKDASLKEPHDVNEHETKVKEEGSSRRNITRKKSEANAQLYNNRKKKQGGAGYVWG